MKAKNLVTIFALQSQIGRSSVVVANGYGLAWNGSLWVAVGTGIATSTIGITWVSVPSGLGVGYGVAWNGSIWVVVGDLIVTSSDANTWTPTTSPFSVFGRGVAWNGSIWVAVGEGTTHTIAYSTNGTSWTGLGNSIFTTGGYGVAWNGSLWVAVGVGTLYSIAYSSDGINWTGVNSSIGLLDPGESVAWNGSFWIVVGQVLSPSPPNSYSIVTSPDGINWTGVINTGTLFGTVLCVGNGVAYNSLRPNTITFPTNRIVAVGSGTNKIVYSPDGNAWTAVTPSPFSTQGTGVAWNGSMWVAVGVGATSNDSIAYSLDNGISWLPPTTWTNPFTSGGNGIAWNGSMWEQVQHII